MKKGGTGATTPAGALENLLPSFTGNDGKVLGLNSGTPQWVAQSGTNAYMFPDYNKQENTNRINTPNGYWISDRDGYALVTAENSTGRVDIQLDNVIAYWSGSNGATGNTFRVIVQVLKGQKITINVSSGASVGCYFIPPIYSTPPQPIVVDEGVGGSYSPSEVKTAETWLDGEPIYKKTISFTTSTTAANGLMTIGNKNLLSSDVRQIVEAKITEYRSATYTQDYNPISVSVETNDIKMLVPTAWGAGNAMFLTAYYTKTTD
ncbi:MAG: hypothetical protein LBK50_02950 [Candidatus Nomurabacteria bacterium]|nr:hypothetical protein [Candidatus Nomurabacteria bacterium]